MRNCLFVMMLALLLLVSISRAVSMDSWFNAKAEASSLPATTEVTVEQGDSIWSIASRYKGSTTTVMDMAEKIIKENQLTNTIVHPGQVLTIPLRN